MCSSDSGGPSFAILSLFESEKSPISSKFLIQFNNSVDNIDAMLGSEISSICHQGSEVNSFFSDNCDTIVVMSLLLNLKRNGWNVMTSNAFLDSAKGQIVRTFYLDKAQVIEEKKLDSLQQSKILSRPLIRRFENKVELESKPIPKTEEASVVNKISHFHRKAPPPPNVVLPKSTTLVPSAPPKPLKSVELSESGSDATSTSIENPVTFQGSHLESRSVLSVPSHKTSAIESRSDISSHNSGVLGRTNHSSTPISDAKISNLKSIFEPKASDPIPGASSLTPMSTMSPISTSSSLPFAPLSELPVSLPVASSCPVSTSTVTSFERPAVDINSTQRINFSTPKELTTSSLNYGALDQSPKTADKPLLSPVTPSISEYIRGSSSNNEVTPCGGNVDITRINLASDYQGMPIFVFFVFSYL